MIDLTPWGLAVGHSTDAAGATGCTVVRGIDGPFRASAALLGRASGTRELPTLDPEHLVDRVDAILLTGGSAYGLGAASGVMRWMEERKRGFPVGPGVVPIVPGAVVFDLAPLGRFDARPSPQMGYDACNSAASSGIAEGSVGVGTGTTVGKAAGFDHGMKGGFAMAEVSTEVGRVVAMTVVNALGDVRDASGAIIAGARGANQEFVDGERLLGGGPSKSFVEVASAPAPGNTTLSVVATTAPLSRVELQQLARAACAALHRRITPTGTTFDGDVVFAISPIGERGDLRGDPAALLPLETLAVRALEQAIERAVRTARGRDGLPGLADESWPPR